MKTGLKTLGGVTAAAFIGLGTQEANAQSVTQITQQAVNSAVQSVLQNIRDQI